VTTEYFLYFQKSRPALVSTQSPLQSVSKSFPDPKATEAWKYSHPVLRLRTSGAIPLLPITTSRCEQEQNLYLPIFFNKIRAPQELGVAHSKTLINMLQTQLF